MQVDRNIVLDHRWGGRPKIESDAEVRAFIDDLLPHLTFKQLAQASLERFGKPRAPSKSAIGRYWRRRKAA